MGASRLGSRCDGDGKGVSACPLDLSSICRGYHASLLAPKKGPTIRRLALDSKVCAVVSYMGLGFVSDRVEPRQRCDCDQFLCPWQTSTALSFRGSCFAVEEAIY